MKMTKKRKSLQDKLRRKFGWKTANTPSIGWTGLLKEKAEVYSRKRISNDLAITFNETLLWGEVLGANWGKGITIDIRQYDDSTEKAKVLKSLSVNLTFEELEMIYNIAKEKRFETIAERSKTSQVLVCENINSPARRYILPEESN